MRFLNHFLLGREKYHATQIKDERKARAQQTLGYLDEIITNQRQMIERDREIEFARLHTSSLICIGAFDCKKREHIDIIKHARYRFKRNLDEMRILDRKALLFMTLGLAACITMAAMGPVSILIAFAVLCFCYAAFLLGQRQSQYSHYNKSLNDYFHVFVWCLNDRDAQIQKDGSKLLVEEIKGDKEQTFDDVIHSLDENVQNLITDLCPLIDDNQLNKSTRNDANFDASLTSYRNRDRKDRGENTKQDLTIEFSLYGYGQDTSGNVLLNLYNLTARWLTSLGQRMGIGTNQPAKETETKKNPETSTVDRQPQVPSPSHV